jgi:hypothetical protein
VYAGAAAALSVSAPSLVATDETGTVTTDTNSGELCTSACGTGNYLSVDVFGLTLTQNVQDSAYTWCAGGPAASALTVIHLALRYNNTGSRTPLSLTAAVTVSTRWTSHDAVAAPARCCSTAAPVQVQSRLRL